jgi:hypothetical protein
LIIISIILHIEYFISQNNIIKMKHMTCVNHKEAQQVCISPSCKASCSYVCFEGGDNCRDAH